MLSAIAWGVGDFSSGMGVRETGGTVRSALRFIVFSHGTSLALLVCAALALGEAFPHGRPLVWGLTAGVTVGASATAFYIALARGAMGTSAAISGVLAAAIPALFAMAAEGAPGWRKGTGFCIAGLAIWLIAAGDAGEETRSATWLAIAAGAGFGVYFVMLKFAAAGGAIWPAATSRMGSLTTCAVALLVMRGAGAVGVTGRMLLWVGTTVLFDTGGNLLFLVATRRGRLDVAAVLAAMYPVTTILLAAWRTHERPTQRQGWGMAAAGVAVVLIAG